MENDIKELIDAYDNYIKLLSDELDSAVSVAHVHHWKSNNIKEGEEARKRIDRAKLKINFRK